MSDKIDENKQALFNGLLETIPILTYQELVEIRNTFEHKLNEFKNVARDTLVERFTAEREAIEQRYNEEAVQLGFTGVFANYAKVPKPKLPPKYRDPENPNRTWVGRGKKPTWFTTAIAGGLTEEDMLIHIENTPDIALSDTGTE